MHDRFGHGVAAGLHGSVGSGGVPAGAHRRALPRPPGPGRRGPVRGAVVAADRDGQRLAHFSLTGHDDDCDADEDAAEDDQVWSQDTFDGVQPTDDLDEAFDLAEQHPDEPVDSLDVLRRKIRRAELHRRRRHRRRVRPKSGVTTNVHIDLRTLSGHGPTRTDNGALLCRFHHRLVHEHHWTLAVDDTGHWTATDRHGTTFTGRPAHVPSAPAHDDGRSPTHQR